MCTQDNHLNVVFFWCVDDVVGGWVYGRSFSSALSAQQISEGPSANVCVDVFYVTVFWQELVLHADVAIILTYRWVYAVTSKKLEPLMQITLM